MRRMTHEQIIRSAGKVADIAKLCSVKSVAVYSWVHRGSIPAKYWAIFARAGFATLEQLADSAEKAA